MTSSRRVPHAAVAVVLALTLGAPAARAGADDYQRFLNAAVRMHENLEYERALEQVQNAKKQATTPDQQATALLHEGIIFFDLNRPDDAKAALKEGLFLNPDAKLPLKVSPRVESEFENLRLQVKKELAPLLKKQEEERLKAEAEARAREQAKLDAEKARLEAEKAKADAEAKKAEIARLEAQKSQADLDAKRAELARLEEQRRLAEQKSRDELAKLEAQKKLSAQAPVRGDTPVKVETLPPPPPEPDVVIVRPVVKPKGAPVGAIVLACLGAAAAGGGAFLGSQSQSQVDAARSDPFQDSANRTLSDAKSSAQLANVLFGTAGALGLGAIIAGIVHAASGDDVPPPAVTTTASP
jgi:hypothetical protein